MRRTLNSLFLATALAAACGTAAAQDFVFGWNPRSGDVWVDTQLRDINQYGYRYRDPFIDEMVRYHAAPRDLVFDLLVNKRWAPGDVYYACSIAAIVGRPCRYVVEQWERDHAQGWGALAQRLGIKPGSAEFHRLKRGFVPTYDRWARPISLDDDLRRAFPDRGKGKGGNGKGGKSKAAAHGPDHAAAKGGKGKGDAVGGKARQGKGGPGGKGKEKGKGSGKGEGNGQR